MSSDPVLLPAIVGFDLGERLHASSRTLVYRARRVSDGGRVLLKLPREEDPPPDLLERYRKTFALLQGLSVEGVSKPLALLEIPQSLILVLADGGGASLEVWRRRGELPLAAVLAIGADVARALEGLHAAGLVHRDLSPGNLIWSPDTGRVEVIDFDLATDLELEQSGGEEAPPLEGNLLYIAPEQTGRMNQPVDHRSDYYALGAVLYQLLTGQPPFYAATPLELIHAHLARLPPAPCDLDESIPPAVSDLVMKLLAKSPEARYQSAHGLAADLDHCLAEWSRSGRVAPFPLGRHDRTDRLRISQRLYGRERELELLLNTFRQLEQGGNALVLVSGQAGVGKSSLVHELRGRIAGSECYYAEGKFDQFQRNLPYAAWLQVVTGLVRQWLGEGEAPLTAWRLRLTEVLGQYAAALAEVAPVLVTLLGELPPAPALGAQEARNRFLLSFLAFLRASADRRHPLVVFLDDLQWIDQGSLTLLEALGHEPNLGHLLIIGAYREQETPPGHPLALALADLERRPLPLRRLHLDELTAVDLGRLLADTLGRTEADCLPLAQRLQAKTRGNPFFCHQLLRTLVQNGVLRFDQQQQNWDWELAAVDDLPISDNVVTFMLDKVAHLPTATQELLRLAACLGLAVAPELLTRLDGGGPLTVRQRLQPALEAGLMLTERSGGYRFSHDRVLQAVYGDIPAPERQRRHLANGRRLLASSTDLEQEVWLFELIGQFNQGLELLDEPAERLTVARLNLRAGRKAHRAGAFAAARVLFRHGLALLPEGAWHDHYPLTFGLHRDLGQEEYLNIDFAAAHALFERTLAHARDALDRTEVYELMLDLHTVENHLQDAIDIGLRALAELGEPLPEGDHDRHFRAWTEPILQRLAQPPEDPTQLPEMIGKARLASMRLLSHLFPSAYIAGHPITPLITARMVQLSLEHGLAPESPMGFSAFGLMLTNLERYEEAFACASLALAIQGRCRKPELRCRVLFFFAVFIQHWTHPLQETLPLLTEGYRDGLEHGDLQFTSYSINHLHLNQFLAGQRLSEVANGMERFRPLMQRIHQDDAIQLFECLHLALRHLQVRVAEPDRLQGERFDEPTVLALWRTSGNVHMIGFLHWIKGLLLMIHERPTEALRHAESAAPLIHHLGMSWVVTNHFVRILALAATLTADDPRRAELDALAERLNAWAQRSPVNYAAKAALAAAERSRLDGAGLETVMALYDRAIDLAREHHHLMDTALALELASRHFHQAGKEFLARAYLREAHRAYRHWGAAGKARLLEERYPRWLLPPAQSPGAVSLASTSSSADDLSLDFDAVLEGTRAISREIVKEDLVARLIQIVIASAGAERGGLILPSRGSWRMEVLAEGVGQVTMVREPLESCRAVCVPIIHMVSRSGEGVVLDDARQSNEFAGDPYLGGRGVRSLLCLPLRHQGRITGIVYLENNLASHVFTLGRVQVVELLAAQAAISLENALVYEELQGYQRELELRVREEVRKRQRQEQMLVQQSKLAAMGEMIGNIAHQWRQPLNTLSIVIQDLEDAYRHHELDRTYLEETVAKSTGLVQRMSRTIDDFRHFFTPDRQKESFDLAEAVREALVIIDSSLHNNHITLTTEVRTHRQVFGYRNEFGQVILNLLSNAKDALVKNRPRERRIQVEIDQLPGGRLRIQVSDNGGGIAAESLDKIFDPYYTTKFQSEGTGLGLYMSKMIVEKSMGGQIHAYNTAHGASFCIELDPAP